MTKLLIALGLTLAIAAPTVASAGALDDWKAKWDAAHTAYADKVAAALAAADTGDRDFWLKCTFHKTDACDAALAKLMG